MPRDDEWKSVAALFPRAGAKYYLLRGFFASAESSGTYFIKSDKLTSRVLQITSKCSNETLSAYSWYNSLIVFGRIPVALDSSAWVILFSPKIDDSKILIITPLLLYR